ncbi:MAG: hypothetical protein IAX22_00535 [Candidatus Bathyarchaeota archaeon]|nr:hypothetical protein [Candidatus Bathyarchaeota archaeon]
MSTKLQELNVKLIQLQIGTTWTGKALKFERSDINYPLSRKKLTPALVRKIVG